MSKAAIVYASERPHTEVLADAIQVLTEAARLTRPILEKDEAASTEDHPVWVESGRREPADWAEFVAKVLCAAAANVGSTARVLAGRPGSWETSFLEQLIRGTVGWEDEYLTEHRTEPLEVTVYVDELLSDAGVWSQYDKAFTELTQRQHDLPDDDNLDEAAAQIDAMYDRLEQQRKRDWAEFGVALKANMVAEAARVEGLRVPVVVHVDLEAFRGSRLQDDLWYGLEEQIFDKAIRATPLPGDGRTPLERLEQP